MGAAQCPSRKPSAIAVPVVRDISTRAHGSEKYIWPSSPSRVSHESARGNEAINQPIRPVIPKATVPAKAAMPKASVDQHSSSIPIRYRRWSYDAMEEDQKRSLRMLCPMEAAKLIPELEPIPPLTMAASSWNSSHLEQHLDELSADLVQTHAGLDSCGTHDQCSVQDVDAISIQDQIRSGLDVPSQYVQTPWSADAEVTLNSRKASTFNQDFTEQRSAKSIGLPPGLVDISADQEEAAGMRLGHGLAQDQELPSSKFVGEGSLRQDLELLRGRNHRCVVVVRKIKQLGFEAPSLLTSHFSKHGDVEEVLVALTNSRRKSKRRKEEIRTRPAAMGFVVMKSAEGAARVLQFGELQDVQGVWIQVHPFSSFARPDDEH